MIYQNIIKNDMFFNQFQDYIKNESIPNAFLFYGGEGVGKFAHAVELSYILLSQKEDSDITYKKIKNNRHENIHYISPLPRSKSIKKNDAVLKALSDIDIENIQKQIKLKLSNPYHRISIDKANTILINSIRDIKSKINLSSYNNQWNIYIITNAEKLCYPRTESGNALLKILEEPNENNLFILLTSNISQVLDTITSRCTKFFFPNPSNQSIKEYLINENKFDDKDSKIIANICCGNITLALSLFDNFEKKLSQFNTITKLIFDYDLKEWNKLSMKLKDHDEIKLLCNLLIIFLTDVIQYTSSKDLRFNYLSKEIDKWYNRYNIEDLYSAIEIINKFIENMGKNTYLPLLFAAFYIEINKSLNRSNFRKKNFSNYSLSI